MVVKDDQHYLMQGRATLDVDSETVHITELPIGKWTQEYKQFLDSQRVEAIKEKEKEKAKAAKKGKKKAGEVRLAAHADSWSHQMCVQEVGWV